MFQVTTSKPPIKSTGNWRVSVDRNARGWLSVSGHGVQSRRRGNGNFARAMIGDVVDLYMKGVGYGMNRKIILGSYFGVLIIIAIIVVILYLIERENSMPVLSDDFQDIIYELTLEEMELTEEQYQLLRDSLLHVDHMNAIRRRNAWLILDEIKEIEFVENRCPGRSNVGDATWILDVFGVGEIKELSTIRVMQKST